MDNQNNNNQNNNKNPKQGISFILLVTVITSILVMALFQFQGNTTATEITYDEFLNMVDKGEVAEVELQNDKILITGKKGENGEPAKEY